jgi:dTMP kinase
VLIVLEGIDGSGKSTQAAALHRRLRAEGVSASLTQEPTSGPIGQLIRRCLTGDVELDERSLTLLYAADRLDHLTSENGMLRDLEAEKVVVCDRYYHSSYAYHSDTVGLDWIVAINSLAVSLAQADVTILLDVSPAVAIDRLGTSRGRAERYEHIGKLERVRTVYLSTFTKLPPGSGHLVDANADVETISEKIWAIVASALSTGAAPGRSQAP